VSLLSHVGILVNTANACQPASEGIARGDKRPKHGPYRRILLRSLVDTASTVSPPRVAMPFLRSLFRHPSMRLYLLGHVIILVGAWLMEATHSMLPMALAASASLMLSMPLLRRLGARFLAACRRDADKG